MSSVEFSYSTPLHLLTRDHKQRIMSPTSFATKLSSNPFRLSDPNRYFLSTAAPCPCPPFDSSWLLPSYMGLRNMIQKMSVQIQFASTCQTVHVVDERFPPSLTHSIKNHPIIMRSPHSQKKANRRAKFLWRNYEYLFLRPWPKCVAKSRNGNEIYWLSPLLWLLLLFVLLLFYRGGNGPFTSSAACLPSSSQLSLPKSWSLLCSTFIIFD